MISDRSFALTPPAWFQPEDRMITMLPPIRSGTYRAVTPSASVASITCGTPHLSRVLEPILLEVIGAEHSVYVNVSPEAEGDGAEPPRSLRAAEKLPLKTDGFRTS